MYWLKINWISYQEELTKDLINKYNILNGAKHFFFRNIKKNN